MSRPGGHRRRGLAVLAAAAGLVFRAPAQDTAWLRLDGAPQPSAGVQVEGSRETQKVGGGKSTYKQLSVIPTVGLDAKGSVYHPNLCTFNLNGEMGWGWEQTSTESSGYSDSENNSSELQRYLLQMNFLQQKAFNASAFAARDETYRDYGSFSTMRVESTRYGVAANWASDTFSVNTDAGRWDEKDTGMTGYSEIAQTYLNLIGINYRGRGQTTLTGRANHYENTLNSGTTTESDSYGLGLSDSETFGARDHITLASALAYAQANYDDQQLNVVTLDENLNINHSPTLDSYGILHYNHSEYDPATDDRVNGILGVRHRLYDSLVSSLDVHGYHDVNESGDGNSVTYDTYGVGAAEDYQKRLGAWGRLGIGLGLVADHHDQDSVGGIVTSIDEPHQLTLTGPPTYLDHPDVIVSTVVVRGPGNVVCQLNVDYILIPIGSLTQIQLVPTSGLIHSGDVVRVTYQSESTGSASYESLSGNLSVRLDFLEHYGVYGRFNWMDDNAPPEIMTQTITDWILGADYTWRWFRCGVEYENYSSDYTEYQAWRAFQAFTFKPDAKSSLGINVNESTYSYSNGDSQDEFQIFSHYEKNLVSSLNWFAEAGWLYLDVPGTSQTILSGRTGVTWSRGKLVFRAGYDFNNQQSGSGEWDQEYTRSHFFVYAKRMF